MSRLALATAHDTGCAPKVWPCRKRGGVVEERLGEAVADHHAAQRRVAGGDALGERDHVGLVAVALAAEHVAEAAERGDDLVADEQDVVLVADLAHALPVAVGWGERAAGVLHRLHEHRGDAVGALHLDAQREVVGAAQRAGRRACMQSLQR